MANEHSTETESHQDPLDNPRDSFDALWRILYAISGCRYAMDVIGGSINPKPDVFTAVDGLNEAITRLAAQGERIAANARDRLARQESIPAITEETL